MALGRQILANLDASGPHPRYMLESGTLVLKATGIVTSGFWGAMGMGMGRCGVRLRSYRDLTDGCSGLVGREMEKMEMEMETKIWVVETIQ